MAISNSNHHFKRQDALTRIALTLSSVLFLPAQLASNIRASIDIGSCEQECKALLSACSLTYKMLMVILEMLSQQ